MFKYISSILSQMSPETKFKSLVALLLAICAIILTPYIIDGLKVDDTECQTRIDRLNKRNQKQYVIINDIQTEVDRLNDDIIKRSRECTDKILERDSYWRAQMAYIKSIVKKLEDNDMLIYGQDTLLVNPSQEDLQMKDKAIQNIDYLLNKHK